MKSRAVMLLDAAHQQQLPPPPPTSPPNIPPPSVGRDEQSTTAPVTPVNANANDGATEVIDNIMFEMESFLVEQQQTEHMTTITVIFISVVQEIVSLITAVTNRFNRQFIDITATAVHSIGEITREIREAIRKKEDPKDAKDKKSMAVLKRKLRRLKNKRLNSSNSDSHIIKPSLPEDPRPDEGDRPRTARHGAQGQDCLGSMASTKRPFGNGKSKERKKIFSLSQIVTFAKKKKKKNIGRSGTCPVHVCA